MKRNLSGGAKVLKKACGVILAACLLLVLPCGRGEAAIRDLRDLNQEPLSYVDPAAADRPPLPPGASGGRRMFDETFQGRADHGA